MSEARTIDARAMSCPAAVQLAAQALKEGCADLTVFTGDIFTVECLTRLAGEDWDTGVAQKDGCFAVVLREKAGAES